MKAEKEKKAAEKVKESAARAKARKDKSKKKKKDAPAPEGPLDTIAIKKMKPKDLKIALKARGLSYQGSKKELQERLMKAI